MQKKEKYREDIKGIVRRRMGGMAKITVITHAYNPGKYIYQCVDSVLAQTFEDFEYLILDNGSVDGTKEVLEEYAKKDARIRLYRNEDNSENIITSVERYVNTEYFTVLDHDDYLVPDALESLYDIAERNDLDMAFGRCMMMNANGTPLADAGVSWSRDCFDGQEFLQHFDELYWQLRTLWGKLIRTELMQYVDLETLERRTESYYAWDTVIILSIAFAAKQFGTINKIIHHYRVFDKSDSQTFHRQRFLADWILLDMARNLLKERGGFSARNEQFLFRVYYNAIMDTLRLAMGSDYDPEEKCEIAREIVEQKHTGEMYGALKQAGQKEASDFVKIVGDVVVQFVFGKYAINQGKALLYQWIQLLYGREVLGEGEFAILFAEQKAALIYLAVGQEKDAYAQMPSDIFCEICPGLYLLVAMGQEKEVKKICNIIMAVAEKRTDAYKTAEALIETLIRQNKLLAEESFAVWKENPDIVVAVCAEEYYTAINLCLERLDEERWQKSGGILELAITLAALLEEAEAFVALKKLSCNYLVQEGKTEEAASVLKDLEEMCPEDPEIEELRTALQN